MLEAFMNTEERGLILDLFARLRAADRPDKDREAADFINRCIADSPAAPYLLVQTVLVQEHALKGAQARIADLETQLAQRSAATSSESRSFLSGLFGAPQSSPQPTAQRGSSRIPDYQPPPSQPYSAPLSSPGGGFLQHAMATAAGVAGGALVFEGIQRMMGHSVGPFSGPLAGAGLMSSPWGATPPVEETVVNNYYDRSPAPSQDVGYDDNGSNDPGFQDADYDSSDSGDMGGSSDI
jgi:uncharacterized protein